MGKAPENQSDKPAISVVIPVHNAEHTIRDCVESILASPVDFPFEIVVVDDGSPDGSIELIQDLDVRVIRQECRGASAARNAGARASRSDLVVFVDADVVFPPEALGRIHQHLSREDVDYVSVLYSREPLNEGWHPRYRALANYCYYFDFIFSEEQKKGPIRGETLGGGAEAFDKGLFFELGGFDETIKGAGIENEVLLTRMKNRDRMLSDASIQTRHHFPGFRRLTRDYFSRTFEVMSLVVGRDYDEPYMRRNTTRVALGALVPVGLAALVLTFALWPVAAPIVAAGWLLLFGAYLWMHRSMFVLARRDAGAGFTLFTLAVNIHYCFVIALAGGLGTIWSHLRGRG